MCRTLDVLKGTVSCRLVDYAKLGITTVEVVPSGDPVAYTTTVAERIVPRLAELGP